MSEQGVVHRGLKLENILLWVLEAEEKDDDSGNI